MKLAEKLDIIRYSDGEYHKLRDLMVNEIPLTVYIPGVAHKVLYCSPKELDELVLGHLYCQRYIRSLAEVDVIDVDEDARCATVRLNGGRPGRIVSDDPFVQDNSVFDVQTLLNNQARFYDESTLQKATAGVHRCALCDNSGTYMACIDVSRHNAFDKLVGKALMAGISLEDKYVITSGRVPYDMIQKAIAAGLPMVVSRSTPTIAAVRAAKAANMTLLGFSRENRFNIYCGERRLSGCC